MKYFWNLFKNIDKILLFLPVCFALISIVMISSTASQGEFVFAKDVKIQFIAYLLGFCAMSCILLVDYKLFENWERPLYIGSIFLLLTVYIPGLGVEHYGARSWIDLKVVDFQPSEIVKITFVILMALYLSKNHDTLKTYKGVFRAGLYASPFIVIVLKEDLGGAIVLSVIWLAMIFYAGIDYKILGKSACVFVVALPIVYRFMASHQKERIDAFLHPDNLGLAGNYQVWQSKVAIGSGGFFGKGLFQGTQKELKFLPVQKSDFIYSVIVEELGMIGGALVIALYAVFLYKILKIAYNAKENYGALIAIGFIGMFGFQVFENIAMTLGAMPVTGITLPFISYGGSSVVANMIALGFILNVGIRSKLINF
ncbi:rod shape-determining protein RodA [Clostridium aminobutyricum]|uniref:Rod shape-determining protein RodA n=1 Tax=Clostridium aminobutyricum TaxID=33953 RepID=A0A939IIP5_CLOAM|nr:rod shape-determining protein RodA [Clostridium aminobutyricum]MBN7772768.1 rod shape-determining protein RodA [Clostridium aminobutyricum]